MNFTIEELIKNNAEVLTWYRNAMNLWQKIFESYDLEKDEIIPELAKELFNKQLTFEHECGTRWIGQEIMVITGIGQFYKTTVGFDDEWEKPPENRYKKALNLYKAFQNSFCSIEVKFHAKEIAKHYGLINEDRI